MRLQPGVRLAQFEILGLVGVGGMGEVYRARDTTLRREVALKVLPEAFSGDTGRLARLEREARSLAALNHPCIAAIHGFESAAGIQFLVLELVPGPTLAELLARGALPVAEAVELCRQMAEALEEAHGRGIVHRDLKPGNVKLTREGRVKILDFGLAKVVAGDGPISATAPTLTATPTAAGVIQGTPAYMSPEQARGEDVDRRADIWAFGCVLYEALTGRRAFRGATAAETLAAVLGAEPDWSALDPKIPRILPSLVRRCLRKDRQRRLRDIADARLELEEALAELSQGDPPRSRASPPAPRRGARLRKLLPVLGAALLLGGVALVFLRARTRPARELQAPAVRLNVDLPPEAALGRFLRYPLPSLVLSPDGKRLVYVAETGRTRQLYLRRLDGLEVGAIPGTEQATFAFFSPDGRWLGFAADGKLKKVSLEGGPAITLGEASTPRGASWGEDGTIVFAPTSDSGLFQIPAHGGRPRILTRPDAQRETSHRWPRHLPGGRALLFTAQARNGRADESRIAVLSLDTGERRDLLAGGSAALYVPTGHLVYGHEGFLLAVPFDLRRLTVTGPAVTVLENVLMHRWGSGAMQLDVSPAGPLVYRPGPQAPSDMSLVWVDRQGRIAGTLTERRPYGQVALSADGSRLAAVIFSGAGTADLWTFDLARETWTRLTSDGRSSVGVLSPDGRSVAFGSTRDGRLATFLMPADGRGPPRRLATGVPWSFPTSWAPDGSALAVCAYSSRTHLDILLLPLVGARRPVPLVATPSSECGAVFSPDGRWLAYVSDESGRQEVYVRSARGAPEKRMVSRGGGGDPQWSPTSGELFYLHGEKLMKAAVARDRLAAGAPEELFAVPPYPWILEAVRGPLHSFGVSPQGQHLLMIRPGEPQAAEEPRAVIIPNWLEELRRLVPAEEE